MLMGESCMLVTFTLLLMIHSSLSLTMCKKHELEALIKFKHSFTQDPQRVLSSWVGEDCCQWRGVSCDKVTSHVIKLSLSNPQGVYVDYTTPSLVSSELSPSLLELKFLSDLDLSWNNFTGSRIPAFVGSMTKLRNLNLSGAIFSGPIPPQIGNLTNLIHLDLSSNGVNIMLYTEESLEWASSLSKLQSLDLSYNNMSRTYDTLQVLFRLPSLLELNLFDSLLHKAHLSKLFISNTSALQFLDLSFNKIESLFPSFLKNTPFLQSLSLGQNSFSGGFPSWLGNLRCLEYLDVTDNEFHGKVPTLSLAQLYSLNYVDLSNNKFTGLIQDIFGHLTHELETLIIGGNSIQGTISHIGNLSKLVNLDISNNNIKLNLSTNWQPPFQLQFLVARSCEINTPFPQWLRNQTQIQQLDLSYTGISGELPQWLGNFTNLKLLQLAGNKLTGSLPRHITCDGCNLDMLDLHNNMLSGTIPHWLKHLKTISLIDLSENLLSGGIFGGENGSSLLSGSKSLQLLDLSYNMFSGEVHLTNNTNAYSGDSLELLSLRGNEFSGPISSQLCHFTSLLILELAHNRLTGNIPPCLGSVMFKSGSDGYSSDTGVETQEIIKGTTENFNGTISTHSMIDLSCNHLVGTIPEELANITNLMQLNLSNNRLTGRIPNDIGNLHLLESLDLSNNNLSGTIPQSLSNIPWLSVLNLSNNHLHGPIPTGSQLQTLDNPSNYAGNPGLCGFPLPNKCSKPNLPPSPTDDNHEAEKDDGVKDKLDKLWLYLAIMSGVATGFWGVVLTLVFKKSWRYAYFRFVEKVGDRIYVPFKVRMNRFNRARTENSG